MNWKLFVVALGLTAFVSCGGGPKKDAQKICDCMKEAQEIGKDEAKVEDAMKKAEECVKMAEEIEAKYKDDKDKMKELDEAGKACMEEMEKDMK